MGKDVRSQNPPTSSLVPPSCCSARQSEEPGSWDVEPTVRSLKANRGALAGLLVGEVYIGVPQIHVSFPSRSC